MEHLGATPPIPSANLEERIASEVSRLHARRIKRLLGAAFLLVLAVAALSSPAVRYLGDELSRSGFTAYFSLLFSDPAAVIDNFSDFASVLAETFPVVGFAFTLAAAIAGIIAVRNIIIAIRPRRFVPRAQ